MSSPSYLIQTLESRVLFSFGYDDPTFNPSRLDFAGRNAERLIALPSGQVLAAGSDVNQIRISRLAADGQSLDSNFGVDGSFVFPTPNVVVGEMIRLPDGRIRALSSSFSSSNSTTHRPAFVLGLTAEGAPDPSFGTDGVVTISLSSATPVLKGMAVDSQGRLVVVGATVGQFGIDTSTVDSLIVRLQSDGQIDSTFGGGLRVINFSDHDRFHDVMIDSTDRAIVYQTVNHALQNSYLTRYDAAGVQDTSYGGIPWGLTQYVNNAGDLKTDAQGRIYISVDLRVSEGISVVRFNPTNGRRDTRPGGSQYIASTGVRSSNMPNLPYDVTPDGRVTIATRDGYNIRLKGFDALSGFPDENFGANSALLLPTGFSSGTMQLGAFVRDGDRVLYSSGVYESARMTVGRILPDDTSIHYGGVEGLIFSDSNANGVQDVGEAPIRLNVYDDANDSGTMDPEERRVFANADGTFRLTNLVPGQANIRVRPNSYTSVAPADGLYNLTISSGAVLTGRNYAMLAPGLTVGRIFRDDSLDGNYQTNEPGIAGRTVYIDQNNNAALDAGELTAVSDATGAFTFNGLTQLQTYRFRQVLPPGILQSHPERDGAVLWQVGVQNSVKLQFGSYDPAAMPPAAFGGVWNFSNFFGVDVVFSENVAASVEPGDFQLNEIFMNQISNVAPITNIQIIAESPKTIVRVFLPLTLLFRPPDVYDLTIPSLGSITDPLGTPLMAARRSIFAIIPGDATFNNSIGIEDFALLASNFNRPGGIGQGDFNYDQFVSITDFALLASNFNRSLPPPTSVEQAFATTIGRAQASSSPFAQRQSLDRASIRSDVLELR